MTLIPNFQEFEETNPLNGKITPALAESLAEYFADQEGISESSALDSIKNTLSKTFLGSLSYISMIDKVRTEVLKAEKELLSKRYAYEDEIDSLKTNLKEISKTKDASANIAKAERTISNKTNEYQTYTKMVKARIEKALKTLSDAIKGNKRRMEYWEAGKSQDELELAEFEYKLAKQRASSNPEELKELETEIKKVRDEAEKSRKKLEADAKSHEDRQKEGSSDYRETLRNKKGRIEAIAKLDHEIIDLEKDLKNARKDFDKKQIQREIDKLKGTKEDIQDLDKRNKGKEIMKNQEFDALNKLAKEVDSLLTTERKPIGFISVKSGEVSGETAGEKGKKKAEEVKKQEVKADVSDKVNSTLEKKKK